MTERAPESVELEALLWAWTNAMGRLPDDNTMTEAEIAKYWEDYAAIVKEAILKLTGMAPDDYYRFRRAVGEEACKTSGE